MNPLLKRILFFPITKMILGISICFSLLVGIQNLVTKPIFRKIITPESIADTCTNYISVFVLLSGYYFLFKLYEKRRITELSGKNFVYEFIGGFVLGATLISIIIFSLYLFGYYTITSFAGYNFMLKSFSVLVVAALLEEIFFRLIIYRICEIRLGTYYALTIISIVFTIPHLFNDGVSFLSIILLLIFGFAHGIMFTYTKKLWLPFAFHLGWNFAQPFYGSNLSGTKGEHIFEAVFKGPHYLVGGEFGIEDSILSIIALMIVFITFLLLSIKHGRILSPKNRTTEPNYGTKV